MTSEELNIKVAELMGYERLTVGYESMSHEPGLVIGEDGVWRTPSATKWLKEIEQQNVQCVGDYFVEVSTGKIFPTFNGPDTGCNERRSFSFTSDLNAAFSLLDGLNFMVFTCDFGYSCKIYTAPEQGEEELAEGLGDSVAVAICRAFVQLKGVEV